MRLVLYICFGFLVIPQAKASGVSHGLLNSLDRLLVRNNFEPFHKGAPQLVRKMRLNHIYEANDLKSAVFMKWGVPKRKKRFTIRKMHGGTEVYLYKTNYSLALYFYNVPTRFRERVTTLLKGASRMPSSDVTDVNAYGESQVQKGYLPMVKTCVVQAFNQASNDASGLWEGLKDVATDAGGLAIFGKFWGTVKKVWNTIKLALSVFKDKMGEVLKALSNIRAEDARKLICTLTGSLILPIAGSLLAGAGIARLATRLATMVPKIQALSKVLAAYSSASTALRSSIPLEKLIQNALNKGDWLTQRMNRLLKKGHPAAAFGVGACQ